MYVYYLFIYLFKRPNQLWGLRDSYSVSTDGFSQRTRQSGYNTSKAHPTNAEIKHDIYRTSTALCM